MEKLTVNELFAGIGAFRKALINQNIPHEIVGISEIDKYAIKSYEAMYGETRNYGDISKIERLDYADLWTYGFPCQDISLAGDMKGIVKGETRSGLLHEVERLLEVAQEEKTLPEFLIMENVKNLVSKKFIGDFQRWIERLSEFGYTTFWKVLVASDYGIPQRRERVFAVSVRKDKGYSFPNPIPLEKKFLDFLQDEVEEKYFLRKEIFEYFERHSEECKEKGLGFRFQPMARGDCEIAKTITTREGTRGYENFIQDIKIIVPEATKKGYGVRKLTPRECWRLMGFTDSDFDKAQEVCSDTQLYKQAGNSIVVQVLEGILKNLIEEVE